jgi:hypothetical protein
MGNLQSVDHELKRHMLARFQTFGQTSLRHLMTPSPVFYETSQPLLDYLSVHTDDVDAWFRVLQESDHASLREDTLNFLSHHMLDYVHSRNQYVKINQTDIEHLRGLYHNFLQRYHRALHSSDHPTTLQSQLTHVMVGHQNQLMRFVSRVAHDNGGLDFVLQEPVCSTYSADLQLSLLGLDVDQMIQPILDIGCGQDARLVTALRAVGKEAYGIDRMAQESEWIMRGDWFDVSPQTHQWGTVIAHMSFSTHFLHHHLRQESHPEQYAQYYMSILRALKVGGCFAYTPGLPFIESLLPRDRYQVYTQAIRGQAAQSLENSLQKKFGAPISYAAAVYRIR